MGKRVIILGANFLENCIVYPNDTLYNEMISKFVIGKGYIADGVGGLQESINAARALIEEIDLSSYFEQGIRNIKININNASYECVLSTGQSMAQVVSYNQNGQIIEFSWQTTNSLQAPIGPATKLFINLRNVTNTNIANTVVLSDIITSVELS